jgi:dTMP kinase
MSLFITFEGGEGVGKTTQIARLAARLRAQGLDVLTTREPGGTPGAESLRELLVAGPPERWLPETEALLMTAARADHVARCIRPALAGGAIVLCDRFVHSTLAYQGAGNGVDRNVLRLLHRFACGDLMPDLVLWLDLPTAEGLRRARDRGRADRFELRGIAFHERVRTAFATMAAEESAIRRIDGMLPPEAVEAAIWETAQPRIAGCSGRRP